MTNTTNNNATVNELHVAHNVLDAITEEALLQDRPKVITNMASKTINTATTIKEEETMKKRTIAIVDIETQECVETTLDALSLEELIDMKEFTKDIIRAYLEEEGVVISNTEFKKTKRAVLIQSLYNVMHPVVQEMVQAMNSGSMITTTACKCTRCGGSGIFYTRVENNIPIKAIPDDGMCYRCQGTGIEPIHEKKTVPVGDFSSDTAPVFEEIVPQVSSAQAKTDFCKTLIKTHAIENKKKGFGTTISAYMLCALILKADCGLEKLKGNEDKVTPEQKETVKKVRQWLLDKGYIKAVTYKTTDGKTVYTDEYDGNDAHKAKMVPFNKSAGLTCQAVTSYKVCF